VEHFLTQCKQYQKSKQWINKIIKGLFVRSQPEPALWQAPWSVFLLENVAFYRALSESDRRLFEQRCLLFLQTTQIKGSVQIEPTDEDRLLVAASAVIPVWKFPRWHYVNLRAVHLLPAAFNAQFQCERPDSVITGMVGSGPMAGKMALSLPALRQGFANSRDKKNVGIHEFVHLLDMADGDMDGFPERLIDYSFSIHWFEFIEKKVDEIYKKQSNIDQYGASSRVEFFAVASEYFFERPDMLKGKHPQLYQALNQIYQLDAAAINEAIAPRKKAPCPCGSGKRYKHCCMPKA
jgi:hypothetical protein